jgi:hypothetical protein
VEARPQNFGRAYRRPQNGPFDALPDTILGAPVEMLWGSEIGLLLDIEDEYIIHSPSI